MRTTILGLIIILFLSGTASGDPSKSDQNALQTPASVIDHFLYAIWEDLKCGNDGVILCMLKVPHYDFEDNVVKFMFEDSELKEKKFTKIPDKKTIEELLKLQVDSAKNLLGCAYKYLPIRYKWPNESFDEKQFRDELSKRTVIQGKIQISNMVYYGILDNYGNFDFKESDLNKDLK